jgi:hypothetical protein
MGTPNVSKTYSEFILIYIIGLIFLIIEFTFVAIIRASLAGTVLEPIGNFLMSRQKVCVSALTIIRLPWLRLARSHLQKQHKRRTYTLGSRLVLSCSWSIVSGRMERLGQN